jgi:hypothetical protein
MPERPRIFLNTISTGNTRYEDVLNVTISSDALGISYLSLAIDPDPNALYRIVIGSFFNVVDMELTAIWGLELPHLTSGFYSMLKRGDKIIIQHKTKDPAVLVKTSATLVINEVVPGR